MNFDFISNSNSNSDFIFNCCRSFCPTPRWIEELLALVPLVVSLPARLAVKPGLAFVAGEALERPLLHTALGAVIAFSTSAILSKFQKGILRADTPRNSINGPRVLFPHEAQEALQDHFRVFVHFTALLDCAQNIFCAEPGVYVL